MENCNCPLEPGMDYETLLEKVVPLNCKRGIGWEPGYICTTLDKALIKARTERDRKEMYEKRKQERLEH